ncbi:nuclear transport factor 2 family protein [Mariprofundus ferrooxydans]|uniref:nuclear transport factor 2 family protein n=1 Tax=Mariprofundus ferrooxydans TaxID=314344 RepID=UPI0003686275|nr:nuclear transport factor 2 family protein [Mariprofundus ferrooxydans]
MVFHVNKPGRVLLLLLALSLGACVNHDKDAINAVLDARDQAVSTHDILAYDALLLPDYMERNNSKADLIIRMHNLFKQFDTINMTSDNRIIRIQEDGRHALCEQSYHLRVESDGVWRELYQREQIALTRTKNGWKISGGL